MYDYCVYMIIKIGGVFIIYDYFQEVIIHI